MPPHRVHPALSTEASSELARLYPRVCRVARVLAARYRVSLDDAQGVVDEAAVDIARRWRPDRGATLATFLDHHLHADACKTLGRQLCRANRYHAAAELLPDLCPAPPPPTLGLPAADIAAVLARIERYLPGRVYQALRLRLGDGLPGAEVAKLVGVSESWVSRTVSGWVVRLRDDLGDVTELLDGRAVG